MEHQQARRNLKITGTANAAGDSYDQVKILGEGFVNGDLDCNDFKCTGTSAIEGLVRSKTFKLRGNASIAGNLQSERMWIQGEINIAGAASLQEGKITGQLTIGSRLAANRLTLLGTISAKGDCEVESLAGRGSLSIEGLLNVGSLDLSVQWPSEVREIGGEVILVRRIHGATRIMHSLSRLFKPVPDARLVADCIEGDRIELENTTAAIVRGNHVKIGPGCVIGTVEYRNKYQQGRGAIVDHYAKV